MAITSDTFRSEKRAPNGLGSQLAAIKTQMDALTDQAIVTLQETWDKFNQSHTIPPEFGISGSYAAQLRRLTLNHLNELAQQPNSLQKTDQVLANRKYFLELVNNKTSPDQTIPNYASESGQALFTKAAEEIHIQLWKALMKVKQTAAGKSDVVQLT